MEVMGFDKYVFHMGAVYLLWLVLVVGNSWWSRAELKSTREKVLRRVAARKAAGESTS